MLHFATAKRFGPHAASAAARRAAPAALLALLACLLCLFAQAAKAAEPMRVVYGFDREFPPFSYEQPGGKPTGFEVEVVEAIFNGTNATLFYRPLNWERIGLELSSGTINITSGMVRTEQRSKLYLFSEKPTFPLQIRLFTKIYKRYPSTSMFRGQMVAVEQGSYQHRLLESFGGMNIKAFSGKVDGLRALYRDEVDAFCAPVQNTYYYINLLNYGAITTVGTPLGMTEMRLAVNRDRGDLLRMVNDGMARIIASGEYDALYRKWFVREMNDQEIGAMLTAASSAALPAYVPYGKKGLGAAVLTATGKIYTACNVENAELSLSMSALRGAVIRAVSEGEFELRAAIVVDQDGKVLAPSPDELQILHEFGRGVLVISQPEKGRFETRMVAELLPSPVVREIGLVQVE